MANYNLLERRRADGSLILTGERRLANDEDRSFPDFFDLSYQRIGEGRWPAATVDTAAGEVRFEYANARATYKITGPLQVPHFTVPEPPSAEVEAQLIADGKPVIKPQDVFKFHDRGYWYEERPAEGIHLELVAESVELFDAPPIDQAKAAELKAARDGAPAAPEPPAVPGPEGAGYQIPDEDTADSEVDA